MDICQCRDNFDGQDNNIAGLIYVIFHEFILDYFLSVKSNLTCKLCLITGVNRHCIANVHVYVPQSRMYNFVYNNYYGQGQLKGWGHNRLMSNFGLFLFLLRFA